MSIWSGIKNIISAKPTIENFEVDQVAVLKNNGLQLVCKFDSHSEQYDASWLRNHTSLPTISVNQIDKIQVFLHCLYTHYLDDSLAASRSLVLMACWAGPKKNWYSSSKIWRHEPMLLSLVARFATKPVRPFAKSLSLLKVLLFDSCVSLSQVNFWSRTPWNYWSLTKTCENGRSNDFLVLSVYRWNNLFE